MNLVAVIWLIQCSIMEIQRTAVEAGVVVESFELDLCGNVRMTGESRHCDSRNSIRPIRGATHHPMCDYPLQRMGFILIQKCSR